MLAAIPATDPVATGLALTVQAACAAAGADLPVALTASAQAVAILREMDDLFALLCGMIVRGIATGYLPDPTEAKALYLEVSELAAGAGHPIFELAALNNLSEIERAQGNYEQAVDYAVRAVQGAVRGGDLPSSVQADVRINLGKAMLLAGAALPEVHPVFIEAFTWASRTRSPMYVARSLDGLAQTVTPSDPETAALLIGAAAAVRRAHGISLHESDQADYDAVLREVEKAIGQERTNELMGSVADINLDQAMLIGRGFTE